MAIIFYMRKKSQTDQLPKAPHLFRTFLYMFKVIFCQICGDHTWQSMKDRFRRIILPNIHTYAIPKHHVARLTGDVYDGVEEKKARGKTKNYLLGFIAMPLLGPFDQ